MKTIATHHSSFHADDVFSVAALSILLNGEYDLIRTRDPEIIAKSDYVVDVDWVYDPKNNRFDHHQKEGAGERENGIPYAGFGLVWKHYGEEITGSVEVAEIVDRVLVQPIDAGDNGVDISKPLFDGLRSFSVSNIISSYVPTWKEGNVNMDERFKLAVEFAKDILIRQIDIAKNEIEAVKVIDSIYNKSKDKSVIIFEKSESIFGRKVVNRTLQKYEDVVYFIQYRETNDAWQIVAVNKDANSYDTRKPFPESWRGKMDDEMEKASGISTAYVCHRRGFMCLTKTKEDAILLAKKALEA